MSLDKLVDSTQLDSDLGAVADAIRAKGGTSAQLAFPAEFVSAIAAIPAGGGGGSSVQTGTIVGDGDNTDHTEEIAITGDVTYFAIIEQTESMTAYSLHNGSAIKGANNEGKLVGARVSGSNAYAILTNANAKVLFETNKLTLYIVKNQTVLANGSTYRWLAW